MLPVGDFNKVHAIISVSMRVKFHCSPMQDLKRLRIDKWGSYVSQMWVMLPFINRSRATKHVQWMITVTHIANSN